MKSSLLIVSSIVALFFMLCVKGPTVVNEDNSHVPEIAFAVDLANVDSLFESSRFAVVEFYSSNCSVCASLVWVIDSLAGKFGDSVLVGANNFDNDTLWKRFFVNSVPTYILFKDGAEITRRSFIENKPQVYDTLATLLCDLMQGVVNPDTGDTVSPSDTTTPANYITLDVETFDTTVLRTGRVAMVFFLYAGGYPCIYMDSVVKSFARQYNRKAVIAKVHAWEQMSISERYNIFSVPQFLFFKDSTFIEQRSGTVSGDTLKATLDRLLAPVAKAEILDSSNFDTLVRN